VSLWRGNVEGKEKQKWSVSLWRENVEAEEGQKWSVSVTYVDDVSC